MVVVLLKGRLKSKIYYLYDLQEERFAKIRMFSNNNSNRNRVIFRRKLIKFYYLQITFATLLESYFTNLIIFPLLENPEKLVNRVGLRWGLGLFGEGLLIRS